MHHTKSLVNEAVKEKEKRSPKRKKRLLRCFARSPSCRARFQREAHDQAHVLREARLISQENSLTEREEASRELEGRTTAVIERVHGCHHCVWRGAVHARPFGGGGGQPPCPWRGSVFGGRTGMCQHPWSVGAQAVEQVRWGRNPCGRPLLHNRFSVSDIYPYYC